MAYTPNYDPATSDQFGNWLTGGNEENQAQAEQAGLQEYNNVNAPTLNQLYTPVDAAHVGPTALEKIDADNAGSQSQLEALNNLRGIVNSGGSNALINQQYALANQNALNQQKANQDTINARFQGRGLGGSGLQMGAALAGGQSGVGAANMQGLGIAGDAANRLYSANMGMGNLGGQINQMQYGQQENLARARDTADLFNTQAANQQANTNAQRQAGAYQTMYGDQMGLAGAKAGQEQQLAGYYGGEAGRYRQGAKDAMNTAAQLGSDVVSGGFGGMGGGSTGPSGMRPMIYS